MVTTESINPLMKVQISCSCAKGSQEKHKVYNYVQNTILINVRCLYIHRYIVINLYEQRTNYTYRIIYLESFCIKHYNLRS